MRKHLFLFTLLLALPIGAILTGCNKADAGTAKIDLQISGMTWAKVCANKVRSALKEVEGVTSARVTLPDKAVVSYIGENMAATELTPKLIEAVKAAGFEATVRK